MDGVQASGQRDTSLKLQTSDNGEITFGYIKWIGDFIEFTRMSFKTIIHNPTGERITGSRCSEETPWFHGRTVVLTSDSGSTDPYDASQQKYIKLNSEKTHSVPTRTSGMGIGPIDIKLQIGLVTKGYEIRFIADSKCQLFSGSTLLSESSINSGVWILRDTGKLNIIITNDINDPFIPGTRLWFSTLNDSNLFSKIKIE